MRGKSFVYEMWDGAECLTVGFTSDLPARLRDYILSCEWAKYVTRIEVTAYPTRREALDAEAARIMALQPKWNTQNKNGLGIGVAAK